MIECLRTLTFCAALLVVLVSAVSRPAVAQSTEALLSQKQLFVMMYTDQGRAIGYQRLLASIELDKIKAELERDHALLEQNRKLYEKNAIPLIELEISQLKDAWNRKQLIVAEKNAEAIGAQFEAVSEIIRYFDGEPVTVQELYSSYRRSWDAGCDKGPDEVVAMEAWAAYAEKSLERARQLNSRGSLSLAVLLEREAELKIARSNAESRAGRLDRCRAVLFPSLEDIQRISRQHSIYSATGKTMAAPADKTTDWSVILKGALLSGVMNAVINGTIQWYLLSGHDPLPLTVDGITNDDTTVFGAAVPLAVSLAMILTAVAYSTVKPPKPNFYPTFLWMVVKHGFLALGVLVTFAVLWQRMLGTITVPLSVAVIILGLVAGVAATIVNFMTVRAALVQAP